MALAAVGCAACCGTTREVRHTGGGASKTPQAINHSTPALACRGLALAWGAGGGGGAGACAAPHLWHARHASDQQHLLHLLGLDARVLQGLGVPGVPGAWRKKGGEEGQGTNGQCPGQARQRRRRAPTSGGIRRHLVQMPIASNPRRCMSCQKPVGALWQRLRVRVQPNSLVGEQHGPPLHSRHAGNRPARPLPLQTRVKPGQAGRPAVAWAPQPPTRSVACCRRTSKPRSTHLQARRLCPLQQLLAQQLQLGARQRHAQVLGAGRVS